MPPPSSSRRWLVPVLIVVVSLTVGGGLLARELYQAPASDRNDGTATTTTHSLEPPQQPGPSRVVLSADAAAHPDAVAVRELLQRHFHAINAQDYDLWSSTVVTARAQAQPREEWLRNYRTTRDGSIRVYRIESVAEDRLTVLLAFTSVQDPGRAPAELPAECIRWQLAFPLTADEQGWTIDTVPAGTVPERQRC